MRVVPLLRKAKNDSTIQARKIEFYEISKDMLDSINLKVKL
jgi:hypothetical protein